MAHASDLDLELSVERGRLVASGSIADWDLSQMASSAHQSKVDLVADSRLEVVAEGRGRLAEVLDLVLEATRKHPWLDNTKVCRRQLCWASSRPVFEVSQSRSGR